MEVKKIVEGMTAVEVAEVIDSNFKGIKEETDAKLSELGSEQGTDIGELQLDLNGKRVSNIDANSVEMLPSVGKVYFRAKKGDTLRIKITPITAVIGSDAQVEGFFYKDGVKGQGMVFSQLNADIEVTLTQDCDNIGFYIYPINTLGTIQVIVTKDGGVNNELVEIRSHLNLLGLQTYTISAWMGSEGGLTNNADCKTLIAPVKEGVEYKYYSGISGAGNGAVYAFYDQDFQSLEAKGISSVGWLDLIAPKGAKYFGACIKFLEIFSEKETSECCLIEKNKWTEYIETINNKVDTFSEFTQRIEPVFKEVSTNIFNPQKIVFGWLGSEGNINKTGDSYLTSDYIAVEPNTFYYLSGRSLSMEDTAIWGYDKDKNPRPLLTTSKEIPDDYFKGYIQYGGVRVPNGGFYADSETYFIRFDVRFNNDPVDYSTIMLEKLGKYYNHGGERHPFTPYNPHIIVDANALKEMPSVLKGKKIAYNGDSFCESRLMGFDNNGGGYAVLIAEATGCDFENRAISGGRLSSQDGFNGRKIVDDVTNMAEDADLICFEGGINDWSSNIPLGEFNKFDYTSEYDKATITGALESIFRQAINKWLGKPIVFIICHKIDRAEAVFKAGTFYDVHDRMVEICKKWCIPYYDAFESSGLNGGIAAQNNAFLNGGSNTHPDGWHPDINGYKKYYVPQLIKLFESVMPL